MTRRRKRLGVIGGGWRRKPRDVEPGRFEPDTRHFSIKEFSMAARLTPQNHISDTRRILNTIKPGGWADLGEYSPQESLRVRDVLRRAKATGKLPKRMQIVRNCENRLIAFYPPDVPWWASVDRKVGGRVVSLPSA